MVPEAKDKEDLEEEPSISETNGILSNEAASLTLDIHSISKNDINLVEDPSQDGTFIEVKGKVYNVNLKTKGIKEESKTYSLVPDHTPVEKTSKIDLNLKDIDINHVSDF